jgi:sodium/pantothenate symporter
MTDVQLYMWIGLALLLLITGYLGYLGYKKTKNVSDFSIAGASLGPVILGLAYAATFFSASTFIGYPGWAYQWGFSSLWIFLTLIFASPLGLIVVAKRARKLNISQKSLSLADWLGDRYNSDFIRVGTALVCLFNIFYIAAQFAAGAWIFNTLLDIPYSLALALIAILVVAYVYTGGSFADIYTDAAQAVLMAIMGVLVFVSIFWMFPGGLTEGFTTIANTLKAKDDTLVSITNSSSIVFYSVPAILGAFIIQFAFSSQPQLFNKVLALKDPKDMRKMILVYLGASVCFILVIFGGLYAAATPTVQVDEIDKAILNYVLEAFPPVVAAFLGVVVIAAAMSTTDGIFVVMSTLVANDVYRKYLVPKGIIKATEEQAEKTALRLSRITVLVVGVIAYILVLNPPPSIGMYIWIGISGVASGTLGPLLIGLFLPSLATRTAAKISLVCGVGSYILILWSGTITSTMAAGAGAVCIGVLAMILTGIFTKGNEDSTFVEEEKFVKNAK